MKTLTNIIHISALLCTGLNSSQGLATEWINPGEEKYRLSLGAFLPSFDTKLKVNNQDFDLGTEIDLENDLGLKQEESVVWGRADWRFAKRHAVTLSYFRFKRDAGATALRDITIEDKEYKAGASLATEFKIQVIPINYHYSIIKRKNLLLTATGGLHWFSINFNVSGKASVNAAEEQVEAGISADAPMPLLGLEFDYFFTKRWTAAVHGEVFSLDFNDDTFSFQGEIWNLRLSTEYWLLNNLGAGFAVNWFRVNVDVNDKEWNGGFDYSYFGPQIYLSTRF